MERSESYGILWWTIYVLFMHIMLMNNVGEATRLTGRETQAEADERREEEQESYGGRQWQELSVGLEYGEETEEDEEEG